MNHGWDRFFGLPMLEIRNATSSPIPVAGKRAAMAPSIVVLSTRSGCHLRDEARGVLQRYGLVVQEIDIDLSEALRKGDCPLFGSPLFGSVVEMDGKIRFRGRMDERLLRRLLHGGG